MAFQVFAVTNVGKNDIWVNVNFWQVSTEHGLPRSNFNLLATSSAFPATRDRCWKSWWIKHTTNTFRLLLSSCMLPIKIHFLVTWWFCFWTKHAKTPYKCIQWHLDAFYVKTMTDCRSNICSNKALHSTFTVSVVVWVISRTGGSGGALWCHSSNLWWHLAELELWKQLL